MPHKIHNIGIAAQIGAYSDAVETSPNLRWLFTSGTPSLETSGNLPSDITAQSRTRLEPHPPYTRTGRDDSR